MSLVPRLMFLGCWVVTSAGCMANIRDSRGHVEQDACRRLAQEVDWSSTEHQELLDQVLEDGVLSIDEATALALVNNNLLRARLEELEIGRAQLLQAVLPSNLIADGAFRFIVQGSGFAFEGAAIQNLLDLLLIPRRKQVATARLKGREADVTAAVV